MRGKGEFTNMGNLEEHNRLCREMELLDIKKVLDKNFPFRELDQKTILITGASGLIGQAIIKFLIEYAEQNLLKIKIIGLCRSKEKAKAILGRYLNRPNLKMLYQDIVNPLLIEESIDYIIHGASITSSGSFVKYPVETINTTMEGTKNILELSKTKNVSGIVYLSSLEVYGVVGKQNQEIQEQDYGFLDPLNVRSSYSEGKRMAECFCISYGREYEIPVKIARLGQTFGCGVNYDDTRVFAEFARCIAEEKDIILHTEGKTIRNYCYTMDAVTAILFILLYGKSQNAYNVANRDSEISIYEMAKQMIAVSESKIQIRIELGDTSIFGYNPMARTVLNTGKLERLGWEPLFPFQKMLENLIRYMQVEYERKNSGVDEHLQW